MNHLISNNSTSNFYNHFISLLDTCNSFIFNVAFINFSGIQLLLDTLKKCEEKAINGKILSSTYLNFTEVKALEKIREFKNIELKIFDSENIGFHAKAYIFEFDEDYKILLGSSNITASAFKTNIEWNIKTISKKDDEFSKAVFKEFDSLWQNSFYVKDEFLKEYQKFQEKKYIQSFKFEKEIKANKMQKKALEKLKFLRQKGEKKALAIAATGSGKTYLAALDIKNVNPKKLLFIVHRENILLKAKKSFEEIFPSKTCGLYTGNKKEKAAFIFATIQTLSSKYEEFEKNEFDYIVIDEAHHITSNSYEKVLNFFESKFLLGLTATPNRMDKVSIYEVFDENIACDIRLHEALEEKLVSSFHYFGISDIKAIDYETLNLNNTKELAKLLMVNKRVDFIIEKINFYGYSGKKRKILAFCVSKEHARFMSEEFNKRAIKSTFLTSEDSVIKRQEAIKELEDENTLLEVIFTIDLFNEGVDIPSLNMCLMLRPTNSPIVFTQQLGRGLRKSENKEFLTLLDFIGNHKKAYLIALALVGNKAIDKESIKLSLLNNFANFSNAYISMDEISKDRILKQLDEENFNNIRYLKEKYFEFKTLIGNKIPLLTDYINYEEFISPLNFIWDSKSYFEFLLKVEKSVDLKDLSLDEEFKSTLRFLNFLLPIKRIYEVVILKSLLINDFLDLEEACKSLDKYLEKVDIKTLKHSFSFLNQEFFDKAQKQRFLKLVEYKDKKLIKTKIFKKILKNEKKKEFIEDSLNYAIVSYENTFGIKDYGVPFLKLYEKYNMLNIAQLCNFNKIHSSFRGSGFLKFENNFFLFITLEKEKYSKASKYVNTFYNRELFSYVSKPAHTQDKGDGEKLCRNKEFAVNLHVFVRKSSHIDKKVQAFIYLGLANTFKYSGNKPIKLKLKLENPLSSNLFEEFTKLVD